MSRIAERFAALQSAKRKALIPFITAGDPQPSLTVPLMHAMVEAGADILELGVPFSDPMAEGPVIQAACERALVHHVSLLQVIAMVQAFRKRDKDTPVVLMGYLNPVEIMGYRAFAQQASAAGVDGLITVDLPPEEAHDLVAELKEVGIDPVFLVAPTSHDERIKSICELDSGFVYYVSLKGVTGAHTLDINAVKQKLSEIRKHAHTPIGVGFGIKDATTAAQVADIADAVVVGSAVVKCVAENIGHDDKITDEIQNLLRSMRAAMDKQTASARVA